MHSSPFSSQRFRFRFLPLFFLACISSYPTPVDAAELPSLTVNTVNDVVADDGVTSLREAIAQANRTPEGSNPVIRFQNNLVGTVKLASGEFTLSKSVSIMGPNVGSIGITLDAGGASRLFAIKSGVKVNLSFLTFQRGKVSASAGGDRVYGGAIVNAGALEVQNCTFTANAATGYSSYRTPPSVPSYVHAFGGAISNTGQLTVQNCTFTGNAVTYGAGGAIYNDNLGTLAVESSTFTGNSSTPAYNFRAGAGGIQSSGAMTMASSIVSGNRAGYPQYHNLGGSYEDLASSRNVIDLTATAAGLEVDSNGNPILKSNGGTTATVALVVGGFAVNKGDSSLATDQRGLPRPFGKADDCGAFELQQSDPSDTQPTVEVTLTPNAPRSDDLITAVVKGTDPQGKALTYSYTWTRVRGNNTQILQERGNTLTTKGDVVVAGDLISVTVVARNDTQASDPQSAYATIVSSPINISSLVLQPKAPYTFERMVATVKTVDIDGPRPLFTFVWTRNGVVTRTVEDTRNSQDIYDLNQQGRGDRGDVIEVTVTASDLTSTDTAKASANIRNSVPVISALSLSPQAPTAKQVVISTYSGRDADGDKLTKIYKWKIGNKVLLEEKSARLDLSKYLGVKAGVVVNLEMRLSDGTALSKTMHAFVTVQANPAADSSAATKSSMETSPIEVETSVNSS
ncbi:hypothetical protein EON80_16960 [bacterium]|nr:MAG: hypothetical protein EON80_16960 [bacterium]